MSRRSFRDRFLTPPVARAIMSPLGIVLFGAGTAAGILVGVPIAAAAGVGVLAWGGRVLAAVPRDATPNRVEPFSLADPWRSYVIGAQVSKTRFDQIVNDMSRGPLRDRLVGMGSRLADGIDESWRIAKRGDDITRALARLDKTSTVESELADLRRSAAAGPPSDATAKTIASLEAQLASTARLQSTADDAKVRLRLLDARFDELVARAVEVSVGAADSELLGNDVDDLVTELEALRVALDEAEGAAVGRLAPPTSPPAPGG